MRRRDPVLDAAFNFIVLVALVGGFLLLFVLWTVMLGLSVR